ncbi:MAG TPA: hypothetical protein VG943_02325 [Caulobacterales bacterium]|nr:hypothetical protein [Caulobacterales bacterium]
MVSSITPGATGANALGVDTLFTRHTRRPGQASDANANGDLVQLGDAANWRAASDSVSAGLSQIQQTLDIGEDAKDFLSQVQSLANSDDPDAQSQLKDLLTSFAARVDAAVKGGLGLIAGGDLSVQAEPGAAPLTIAGLDLRVSDSSQSGGVFSFSSQAQVGPQLADAARASRDTLNAGLDRLTDAARSLQAHQGFLGAATANGVNGDLDADSARLLALQVSQGLSDLGGGAIVNVAPQSVLALFKS